MVFERHWTGIEKDFNGSQPLAMPNGPLHPMVLMVGKQPLMPMDFGDTSIGLGGMAMVFIERATIAQT